MKNSEIVARITVIERALVDLAILVETLRQDVVDSIGVEGVE